MKSYGVLVVDDSAVMRKLICTIIEECPNLFVIGRARNGMDALEKVQRLQPDIMTLDIEMPIMDGLETIKQVMKEAPVPIVMLTNRENETLRAVELGAIDFIMKNQLMAAPMDKQVKLINEKLMAATMVKLPIPPIEKKTEILTEKSRALEELPPKKKEILLIGSSTGGPRALQDILSKMPKNLRIPIFIIQHMPVGFTKALAQRFNGICALEVKEVEHNETLLAGNVYIAPAGSQTLLKRTDDGKYIAELHETTMEQSLYKPSIDITLISFAEAAKKELLTVILTGMGDDGLRGCKVLKKFGGTLLAEAEESCVVYGMPKVVFQAGLVDKQVALPNMFKEIMEMI